jgi:hypothetical protein
LKFKKRRVSIYTYPERVLGHIPNIFKYNFISLGKAIPRGKCNVTRQSFIRNVEILGHLLHISGVAPLSTSIYSLDGVTLESHSFIHYQRASIALEEIPACPT